MPELASPRRLAFRGHIETVAWGFPRSLIAPDQLPSRVLALWQNGARLEEFDWGHVLFLTSPQKVRAEMAPALVLARHKNSLVAAPLARGDELDRGTWVIEDGEWRSLQNGQVVDVSQWLDVGLWSVPTITSLGEVPVVPTVLAPIDLDLRAQSGIQAPDQKWQTIWESGKDSRFNFDFNLPASGFAPSRLFDSLSRWFTPNRLTSNLPLASNRAIVFSALFVLSSSFLFMVQALGKSSNAPQIVPILALFGALLFGLILQLVARFGSGNAAIPATVAPPIVVSPGVRAISLIFFAIGVLRLALVNVESALNAIFTIVIAIIILRSLGIVGNLIGHTPVGGGANSGESGGFNPVSSALNSGGGWLARLWGRVQKGQPSEGFGNKTRDDLNDMWRRLMAQAAFKSGLFKTLGRAQARYLLRSMEMFERGDLEAALRHAIPLGGESPGKWTPPPALGLPGARDNFNISLTNVPARSSFNFGPEVEQRLRELYRRAFERLRDTGDIQKAAFVLADLLHNAAEAVAFLEEHGEYELAAKLAEGRQLPPGLVVRAWWLAGNRQRAIQIAQLREAFADAIVRLEKEPKYRNDVATLRLLWGHHLAGQGRFDAAVEAIWSLEQYRPFASNWMRLGLGENVSPRLLARALALEPDCWNEWRPLIEALLQDNQNVHGGRTRARFAHELNTQKNSSNPTLAVAARLTARALLRDGANEWGTIKQSEWNSLTTLANDGLLRADSQWPGPLRASEDLSKRSAPLEINITDEGGTLNARDAILLENGELLVAFGELGARLLSWDGRTKAQFDVPSHAIVRAFDAPRALLLAQRDEITRVARLDINQRKVTLWSDVRLECYAREFDGATWLACSDGRVRAFDVTSPTPLALWDCGDMGGSPIELAVNRSSLAALVLKQAPQASFLPATGGAMQGPQFESWQFELPSLVLRARTTPGAFPTLKGQAHRHVFSSGEQFAVSIEPSDDMETPLLSEMALLLVREGYRINIATNPQHFFGTIAGTTYTCILWHDGQNAIASLFHQKGNKVLANLHFEAANLLQARECEGIWLFWDDQGRFNSFNPATSSIEHSWILA